MRISEGHKKTAVMLVCLAALLFAVPMISFADGISMNVTYGYRNTAKSGQLLPVTVEIENETEDEYGGYLVMEFYGDDGSTLTYTFPSYVGNGTTRLKNTVTIPDGYSSSDGDRLHVFFTDDGGEKLAEKNVEVFYHGSGQDILCGILSDDRQDLVYLGNVSIGNSLSTKTVTLNPSDIPADAQGLSQLDIIVISSFDMRLITEEAAETIIDWIRSGGTLLLGTGSASGPLGRFAGHIGNISLSQAVFRKMDMGMQYSTTGPDGAYLSLMTRKINWDEADEIFGTGDVPLIAMRNFGSGRICVASCDLCDLSEFGSANPEFTEELLETVLGKEGLLRIRSQVSSAGERLITSEKLTNTFIRGSVPGSLKYVIAVSMYVLFAGALLYFALRKKGLGVYYPLGVIMLSMFFGLIIWFMAGDTRVKKAYIEYGTFIMHPGNDAGETEQAVVSDYIRIGSPEQTAFTLPVSSEASVKPVAVYGNLSVSGGKKKIIALTGQKQFEESILLIEERKAASELPGTLTCNIRKSGTSFRGTVSNSSPYDWSSVFILTGGCVVKLPDIAAGETVDVSEYSPAFGPLIFSEQTADYLSGEKGGQRHDLVEKAVNETAALLNDDTYVIAFAEGYSPAWLSETNYDIKGLALFAVKVSSASDGRHYESSLLNGTKDSSGNYNELTNTITGTATTVVTYSLGNGKRIESLQLIPLSPELSGDSLISFSGQIAIYNYSKGAYELVNGGKARWDGAELPSVLSPTNNITLRFVPDSELDEDTLIYLPVPYSEGTYIYEEAAKVTAPGM